LQSFAYLPRDLADRARAHRDDDVAIARSTTSALPSTRTKSSKQSRVRV